MRKKFFVLTLIFLIQFLTIQTFALTINEKTFKDYGFENFEVNEPKKSSCFELKFFKPELSEGQFFVESIHSEFLPVTIGKAKIEIYINDELVKVIDPIESNCSENKCWTRIPIKKELLKAENISKICINSSDSIPIVRVLNDSMLGIYKMPLFEKENFIQSVSTTMPQAGEKIKVKISFKNSGSIDAFVEVRHVKPLVEERMREEVKEIGNTYFDGIVKAGEEKSFEYELVIKKEGKMTLPGPILTYTNVFGEKETINGNLVDLTAFEPLKEISAFIKINKIIGKTAEAELIIKNNSKLFSVKNIEAKITASEGITLNKTSIHLDEIKANEEASIPFNLSATDFGTFVLSCYTSFNEEENYCEKTLIEFKESMLDLRIIFAGLIALIGGAIYLYFVMKKE